MGTRGYVGFRMYEQDTGVYNGMDSYPTGLGCEMMCFVKDVQSIQDLRHAVVFIIPGEDGTDIINNGDDLLNAISNHTSIHQIEIEDSTCFLADSLLCEWAYIINLDSNNLEVYKGFNNDPHAKGRYAHLHDEYLTNTSSCGVALVLELPFDKIKAMTNDQIIKVCSLLECGSDVESYLQNLSKYNIARPPTTRDRIRLLELG